MKEYQHCYKQANEVYQYIKDLLDKMKDQKDENPLLR